jgi:hypothetical protein
MCSSGRVGNRRMCDSRSLWPGRRAYARSLGRMHTRSMSNGSRRGRPLHHWLRRFRRGGRGSRLFGAFDGPADLVGDIERNGTGVCFLLDYAKTG